MILNNNGVVHEPDFNPGLTRSSENWAPSGRDEEAPLVQELADQARHEPGRLDAGYVPCPADQLEAAAGNAGGRDGSAAQRIYPDRPVR